MGGKAGKSDGIVGFWRGRIGTREKVDSGFELRLSESGELEMYLWQPILNMFGYGPAHPTWDGHRLTFEPFQLGHLRIEDATVQEMLARGGTDEPADGRKADGAKCQTHGS